MRSHHLPWPDTCDSPASYCYCGKRGCIETYLSGPGMSRDHEVRTGEKVSPESIAGRTDKEARTTIARYRRRLAKSLAMVINILDPDAIVLGGGVSNIDSINEDLPLSDYVFSDNVATKLRRARHGDSSGVRGAAWLWP